MKVEINLFQHLPPRSGSSCFCSFMDGHYSACDSQFFVHLSILGKVLFGVRWVTPKSAFPSTASSLGPFQASGPTGSRVTTTIPSDRGSISYILFPARSSIGFAISSAITASISSLVSVSPRLWGFAACLAWSWCSGSRLWLASIPGDSVTTSAYLSSLLLYVWKVVWALDAHLDRRCG